MEIAVLFFLTSGLFLGWALGANDAANVFGTAVGTRMISFTTAAIICSVFVIIGAVMSGAGAAHTLGKLGSINALGGSFMAAFSAALAVYLMTKAGVPVSTTQAIVGSIIGWNLFSETLTDTGSLIKILTTWIVCPLLSAVIAVCLFKAVEWALKHMKLHLLRTDAYVRLGLVLAGAFGSYSLGANNIGNVMGVFVTSNPFTNFSVASMFEISAVQQLFLLGALAISVGVFTYSRKVMRTVGTGVIPLSPIAAWVVVVSHSLVLFLFASQGLESFLASHDLPTIPLVPVSSSQAVVGAVLGIAILKGGRGVRWRVLGGIGSGWVITPIISGLVCFIGLFFMQNVFNQTVYTPVNYRLSEAVMTKLVEHGTQTSLLAPIEGQSFVSAVALDGELKNIPALSEKDHKTIFEFAEETFMVVGNKNLVKASIDSLSGNQIEALNSQLGKQFEHKWQLTDALSKATKDWQFLPANKANKVFNNALQNQYGFVFRALSDLE